MGKARTGLTVTGIIIGIIALVFLTGVLELGWMKFFEPKKENIRREIWEQTQSRVQGAIQDLAKYYDEYNKAETSSDRESIRQVILMRFADFDETLIKPAALRDFLIEMRRY